MKVTDFEADVKEQKIELHIPLIKNFIREKCNVNGRGILDAELEGGKCFSNVDKILYWMDKKNHTWVKNIECKTDKKTIDTGNIVIELATGMPREYTEDFQKETKIKYGDVEHLKALQLVERVINGEIEGKICYGALNGLTLSKNMWLSYMIVDHDKKPHKCLLFRCDSMSRYLGDSYKTRALYTTLTVGRSGKTWGAVGMLWPLSEINALIKEREEKSKKCFVRYIYGDMENKRS
jgi:hypothetical protein